MIIEYPDSPENMMTIEDLTAIDLMDLDRYESEPDPIVWAWEKFVTE